MGAAKAFGGALALMDIDGVRVTFGRENKLDRVDIVPEKNVSVEQVQKNLVERLGGGLQLNVPRANLKRLKRYWQVIKLF